MVGRTTFLALAAAAAVAAPATAASPPGNGLVVDESTCGEILHSGGNSAYIDGQHYIAHVFEFAFGEETGIKVLGQKKGFTGEPLHCIIEEPGGTVTVILLPR